jgi:hypothetical protein
MQLARFVRSLGVVLVLGIAGFGGGCGPGSQGPTGQERQVQIRGSKKAAHQQIREDAQGGRRGANQQGALRKGAGGGAPAR